MGINVADVYVPKPQQDATTGAIQLAATGVDIPTDARTALDTASWTKSLGYVGSDGITLSGIIAAGDKLRDWSQAGIRTLDGQAEPTITIPAMQVDEVLADMMVGEDNVTVTAATATAGNIIQISFDGKVGPAIALAATMYDEDRFVRLFAPSAQVTDIDSVSFVPTDANMYSLTLSLNADSTGHFVYVIYDNGVVTSA